MRIRTVFGMTLFCFLIQTTIFQKFRIMGVIPNSLLIVVVLLSMLYGYKEGLTAAITAGVLQDVMLSKALGTHLFLYLAIALVIGAIGEMLFKDNILTPIMIIGISTVVYHLLFMLFMYFLKSPLHYSYLQRILLIETVINVLIGSFLYRRIFPRVYGYEMN